MKKCIACGVLLCLVLTACAAGAETPTTTEPQLQISSTTTSTIPTVPSSTTPPTSCTPTTVPTTKPTTEPTTKPATMPTIRPEYLCAIGDHEIKDGYCIHCGRVEPKNVDARLIVNGKDITAGNYVKINEGYNNASIPLTAVLTELGIPWEWESDTILRIGSGEYEARLDLTQPTFGWLILPGALGSMREIVDGEVIIDAQALYIYFFRAQNISIERDYETNTIRIERKDLTA